MTFLLGSRAPSNEARVNPSSGSRARPSLLAPSLLAGLVAAGMVAISLSSARGLFGVTQYDDGVYFGSALNLLAGNLPYKDFVLVQPPGLTLLMTPIAWLISNSRDALACARILTAVVTGINAGLVAFLLRRKGRVISLGAGLSLALFPPAYAADHAVLLEPYLVLFCLLAALAVFDRTDPSTRRLVLGGLAFGFATTIKLWALLPLLACLICLGISNRRRMLLTASGAAIGLLLFCGPFFFADPHAFVHQIITTQLARSAAATTPVAERLAAISGVAYLTMGIGLGATSPASYLVPALLLGLIVGGLITSKDRRAWGLERFVLLSAVLTVASLFVPSEFFDHYAYFSAAFLALAVWFALANLSAFVTQLAVLARGSVRAAFSSGLLVVLLAGAVALGITQAQYDRFRISGAGDPGLLVASEIPLHACTISDASILLVTANRFHPLSSTCPSILDSTGTWLSYDPKNPELAPGPRDPALVALWAHAFAHVPYVVLASPTTFRIPWTPALRAEFVADYHQISLRGPAVYLRNSSATSS